MGTILKYALIGGAGYGIHRVCTAISGAFAVCFGVLLVICVLFLIGGLFDFAYYDVTIHNLLALIGGVCVLGIIGMALSGQWFGALIALCVLLGVMGVCKPTVSAFLDRWDTPERRLAESLDTGCYEWGVSDSTYDLYTYSKVDGYCHYNHQKHEDLLHRGKYYGPYPETVVPVKTIHSYTDLDSNEYVRGALENIERLKAAASSKAAVPVASAAPEATTRSQRSFFGNVIHDVTRPIPWIVILFFSAVRILLEYRKERNAPTEEAAPEPATHTWLAEGRKAAGLD